MGEIVTKNTAEKVEVNRLRDAPARLTAGPVVLTTGSHDFPPAAKRLAVLLLARGVRRRWRSAVYPRDHAAKWAKIVTKNTAEKVEVKRLRDAPSAYGQPCGAS